MNFKNRTLFHGDNLDFLRGMNSETVDLIATDPPFNKGKDFHATPDSLAAGAKFEDRWSWDKDVHDEWIDQIRDDWPAVWSVIQTARQTYNDGMGAYLCWLGVRLMEMHRILKDTGSLYLHCDPTASHYIKAILDAIFGKHNFRNEIVWSYRTGGASRFHFSRKHDILFYYVRGEAYTFNVQKEKAYTKSLQRKPGRINYGAGHAEFFQDSRGVYNLVNMRDVWDVSYINSRASDRTGWPTQKPLSLYRRIILASSNKNDMVLDPFAGCATTCIVAELEQRQWVGMDSWKEAVAVTRQRIQDNLQYLSDPDPQVWYETKPPIRTDANEVAAPSLKLRTQVPIDNWQKISHKQIVNILAVAQSAPGGIVCAGCGRILEIEFMELDHMTPKSDRGVNDISNRILLCRPCNGTKRDGLTMRGLIRANKASGWLRDEDLTKQARKTAERTASYVRDQFESDNCRALRDADSADKRALATENLRHILYTL